MQRKIYLSNVYQGPKLVGKLEFEAVLSIGVKPELSNRRNDFKHHQLMFADVQELTEQNIKIAPGKEHIKKIINIALQWGSSKPILIHCTQGHRRSPAALYIMMCALHPDNEIECAEILRQQAPHVEPNPLMIKIADELLNCSGRMIEAFSLDKKPERKLQDFSGVAIAEF